MRSLIVATLMFVAFPVLATNRGLQKVKVQPKIVNQHVTHQSPCPDDPIGTCTAIDIVFENPLYQPVEAVIGCGLKMNESVITVSPRVRMAAQIELAVFVSDPTCEIISWKTLK